jgi:predicted HicB family RNase H-like nuclease
MEMRATTADEEAAPVRVKYTATMERELRKRVKIAAIKKGVVFSQFIEEAVIEKLNREGF